jgi:hypothetical protein
VGSRSCCGRAGPGQRQRRVMGLLEGWGSTARATAPASSPAGSGSGSGIGPGGSPG